MATLHDLQNAIAQAVRGVVPKSQVVDGKLITTEIGIGWPPENALQNIARDNFKTALISVYDRRIVRNSTRWNPFTRKEVVTTAVLQSAVSQDVIAPLGSSEITLSETPILNDAVSAVLTNTALEPAGAAAKVVIAGGADTPSTMATKLATAINGDATLSTWVTAVAVGPVITLTSLLTIGDLLLSSNTGNTAVRTQELGRRLRQFQIAVWAMPEDARRAISDPIEPMVAQLSLNFGLALSDGTLARIVYVGDHYIEDATLEDVLRRDFFLSADYAITAQDMLFSVLAPIEAFAVESTT
jgi:hypothetical protein